MRRIGAALVMSVFLACAVVRPVPGGGFAISPARASADPGQVLKLALSQTPPTVTWTVTGGTIAPDGTFTAPGCASALPATVTITATSGSDSASAVVQVADRVTGVTIAPPTVTLAPGASQRFTATVKTVCNPAGTPTAMKATRAANGKVVVAEVKP
jgi:hypothetical protein